MCSTKGGKYSVSIDDTGGTYVKLQQYNGFQHKIPENQYPLGVKQIEGRLREEYQTLSLGRDSRLFPSRNDEEIDRHNGAWLGGRRICLDETGYAAQERIGEADVDRDMLIYREYGDREPVLAKDGFSLDAVIQSAEDRAGILGEGNGCFEAVGIESMR